MTIKCKIKQVRETTIFLRGKPESGKTTGGGRRELIHYHLMQLHLRCYKAYNNGETMASYLKLLLAKYGERRKELFA